MYNRDPVDALDQLLDQALLTPEQQEARLDSLQLAEWVHQGQTARFYAQQQMMATQQAMADRANKNRRDAPEIQVGSTVYFKPREPYKAKLSSYGLGVFRVTERNDNSLKLVDAHNKERVANIRDLIAIPQETEAKTELQTFQLLQALLHENNQRPETAATEMESETLLAPELLDAPESSFPVHHPWEEGPLEVDDEELPALEEVKALEQNVTPAELPRQILMGLFDDIAALVPMVHPASAPKRVGEEVRATEAPARSEPALPVLSAIQSVPYKLAPQLPRRSQRHKMVEKETNPFVNVTVKDQELYVQLHDKTWLPFGQTTNPDKWRWLRLLRQDSSNPSWYFPALCQMTDQMLLEETAIQKGSSV